MGKMSKSLMIAAAIISWVLAAAAGDVKHDIEVFQVAGKVVCQDCSKGWNEWVNGGKPIKGSKVSVTCLDQRNRVIQYASDLTDDAGEFEIICKKYVNGKEISPQNCYLRLVSSPDPVCNVLTNFDGGNTGLKLHRPTVVYRDTMKFMLGTFYYTSPMCDEPDTTSPDDDDNNNNDNKDDSDDNNDNKDDSDDDGKNNY